MDTGSTPKQATVKAGTLGAWSGFAAQIAAAGAAMIWPNIGWPLFLSGTLLWAAAIVWWIAHREKPLRPDRILPTLPPLPGVRDPDPDEEINLQKMYGLVRERLSIPEVGNSDEEVKRSTTIFEELRQKARDGEVVVRGRQQRFGTAIDGFYKPREAIPAEHWSKMDFDVTRLVFGDSETLIREAATVPDWQDDRGNPDPYLDLTVFRSQIEKAWPKIEKPDTRLIPATAFLKEAAKHSWNVGHDGLDVIRLQIGLREAASHGTVRIYGRNNVYTPSLTRQEPRELIPASFWSKGWLQIVSAYVGGDGNNFSTQAYVPVEKATYVDIHFGMDALAWLKEDAEQFRHIPIK